MVNVEGYGGNQVIRLSGGKNDGRATRDARYIVILPSSLVWAGTAFVAMKQFCKTKPIFGGAK